MAETSVGHIIVSRLHFQEDEFDLMNAYIEVCKQVLVPQLHKQTVQNFVWGVVCNPKFEDYIREQFDYPFVVFYSMEQCRQEIKKYHLQTRHDIDDWMRSDYVESIQNHADGETKAIHAQPVEVTWFPDKSTIESSKEIRMSDYHDDRTSMFLSLYQTDLTKSVLDTNHGKMGKYIGSVLKLPDGLVKWIQHENTVTQNKRRRGNGCFRGTDYGIHKLKKQ